jgi:hypothetical protein
LSASVLKPPACCGRNVDHRLAEIGQVIRKVWPSAVPRAAFQAMP